MKKLFIFVSLTLLAAACNKTTPPPVAATASAPAYNYTHSLQIGSQTLTVEIANTPQAMQQGLSGRASIAQNQGMLFEFGSETDPAFWMPDMKFNLDFIWVNQNKIVGITPDVPAPDVKCQMLNVKCNLPYYYPPSPVDWVVEVNAGWAEKNNIKVGDEVQLEN